MTGAVVVFAGILLASCGRKTAPIPAQAAIPAPIADLSFRLDEKGVTLSWTPPDRTEHGGRLPMIKKFLVERGEHEIAGFCENCPVHYDKVIAVGGDGGSGDRGRRQVTYRDEQLRPGYIYFYRVKTGMGWQVASRPSGAVSFRWQSPMAPPQELQGRMDDNHITLSWLAPTGDVNGTPVTEPVVYQIYRSVAGGSFMPVAEPLPELTFIDQNVEDNLEYQYKIRAIKLSGGTGSFSDQVAIVFKDLRPPRPPQGVVGLNTPDGVRLFWEPVSAADLGGYRLFRRSGLSRSGNDFVEIGRVAASVSSFFDKTCGAEETCYYVVTAFDRASPANESEFSDEIKMKRNK